MALCMFKLTQSKRKTLSVLFITLSVMQILIGFSMTSTSLYIIIEVSPILHTEKAEITFAFAVTGIFGTHVIFHWIIGFKICHKCFKQAHKKSTNSLLLLWSCAGTNTVINLLIIAHFARKMNKHIAKSIKQSISIGMSNYLTDIIWKETIDKLQFNNECCGMISHEDWHNKVWLTKYHVNIESETVNQFRQSRDNLALSVTPWSCCKVDFPMQCLHDPLQQLQYSHIWVDEPNIAASSINTKGCLDGLKKPIYVVISLFIFLCTMVFILHVIIFFTARILYTSSRNAILLNDPEGLAPGWIFGRGDCGYTGGKTLEQIMGPITIPPKTSTVVEPTFAKTTTKSKKDSKNVFSKKDKTGDSTYHDYDYTLIPNIEDATYPRDTILDPPNYSGFNPKLHSSQHNMANATQEDSGPPMSMEAEFARSQQTKLRKSDDSGEPMSMEEELKRLQQ